MEAVSIVTIKNKIPLFKKEEEANAIELIELEEVGFELVAQKGLYKVGDKAVYIQPDYCLSNISLFESFIKPNGDHKKSKLGSNNRIRAVKFNLHRGDGESIYSNGVLLPISEVSQYLTYPVAKSIDLTKDLGITKWEEPEQTSVGGLKVGATKPFPKGIYRTDEENINNLWGHIERRIGYPIVLVGSEKIDGSSITIGSKNQQGFICSRNLEKPLTYMKTVGYRKKTLLESILFWRTYDLRIREEVMNDSDDFVRYGKPVLDKLSSYTLLTDIVLRGELNGGSLKGSGNKNNPASKLTPNIQFYGADNIVNGIAEKMDYYNYKQLCEVLKLDRAIEVFNKSFNSKEELLTECSNYFKANMIEGIVVRTLDSKFSAKIMNLEYDSKK